jgi:uncharacterized C2H2 Zn-finger protein
MLVEAKCVARAWDSKNAMYFYPGEVYKIDRDGPLATLKVGTGYVFEFDRNAGPDDKPHDYSCKRCGQKFKTLADLGRHSNKEHKNADLITDDGDEPVSIQTPCRCKPCDQTFPSRGELMKHKREVHKIGLGIKKQVEAKDEVAA